MRRWRRGGRNGGGGVGVDDLAALTARDCTCVLVQKRVYFGRTADPNSRDLDLIRRLAVVGAKAGGVAGLDGDNRVICPCSRSVCQGRGAIRLETPWFTEEVLSVIVFPRLKGREAKQHLDRGFLQVMKNYAFCVMFRGFLDLFFSFVPVFSGRRDDGPTVLLVPALAAHGDSGVRVAGTPGV